MNTYSKGKIFATSSVYNFIKQTQNLTDQLSGIIFVSSLKYLVLNICKTKALKVTVDIFIALNLWCVGSIKLSENLKAHFGWELNIILDFSNGSVHVHFSFHQWSTGQLERTIILYKNSQIKTTYFRNIYKFYDSILVVFILLTNLKGRKDSLKVKFQGQ